ncbi:ATP-binding protein [Nonomuraea sediminis]|uniref:ATP-binding protein n=1 Tax=Nonomuraea sediminis TaxID=2835864 RepID=UPI001BDBD2BC|nr:AAA family ATPase [Nonomuraea sediminis]
MSRADRHADEAPFVGRRHEAAQVRRMLYGARLLTLTGTGGVGKTRLARRVAEALAHKYPDGVEVIELAGLESGHLLATAVATALGLRNAGSDPLAALVVFLSDKRMLIVLDNCEHLLEDCAVLADRLLRGAPRLRILATSRQTLGVPGEQVLAVPPLSVPEAGGPRRDIARHDAVRLFLERAATALPGFSLDAGNATCVVRLAQRLEGIPLAIELAAARLRTRPLEQVVGELDERFDVPISGSPSGLSRHRTLRATMDWSFELCSEAEQRLWARLSIFPGGTDLDTAEAVCAGDGIELADVVDLLAGLVDKSVLAGEPWEAGLRYRMLESIRAYGAERLEREEARALRARYLDHYLDLARSNRIDEIGPNQLDHVRVILAEVPNLRAALELCFSAPGTATKGLETATALWGYWLLAGSFTEGRYWLERGLDLVPAGTARGMALWVDCMFALRQGDLEAALPRIEECRTLARRPGNESVLPFAVRTAGVAAFSTGDPERGLALLEESLALHRAAGDLDGAAFSLYYAAMFGAAQDPVRAAASAEEFLALCEAHHAVVSRGYAQLSLGITAWNQGDWRRAEELVSEAAEFTREVGDRWCLAQCLEVLAWAACAREDHQRAAWLLGAAHALWQAIEVSPAGLSPQAFWHERCTEQARRHLGERAFTATFRDGARHSLEPGTAVYAVGA